MLEHRARNSSCSRSVCSSLRVLRVILTCLLEFCFFDDNGELHSSWLQKLLRKDGKDGELPQDPEGPPYRRMA